MIMTIIINDELKTLLDGAIRISNNYDSVGGVRVGAIGLEVEDEKRWFAASLANKMVTALSSIGNDEVFEGAIRKYLWDSQVDCTKEELIAMDNDCPCDIKLGRDGYILRGIMIMYIHENIKWFVVEKSSKRTLGKIITKFSTVLPFGKTKVTENK